MDLTLNRRDFFKASAIGASALPGLGAAPARRLKIGHTCITWGTFPRDAESSATLEPALKDISSQGFWGFETFPEVLEDWDKKDQLKPLIDRYQLPLISGYMVVDATSPSAAKDSLAKVIRMGKIIKKYGGRYCVVQLNSVKRAEYDFQAQRAAIISGLNDSATAFADLGLGSGLHQHTGTAIETKDEVYTVMHSVNKYVKFAPDVGQLQKGGADPVQVVKDFLPILNHMHLKDFKGWNFYAGYCPLGQGQVDIPAILDLVEAGKQECDIMVELDPSRNGPQTPLETVQTTKAYLQKLGYQFRS
ncbi:MAG TPA: sugar phosphate isomerase/epimerase [Terracidiphilus sp.]|nr:sugar phosphate isomerase/epimerase [Terracidiphilus sp.]